MKRKYQALCSKDFEILVGARCVSIVSHNNSFEIIFKSILGKTTSLFVNDDGSLEIEVNE